MKFRKAIAGILCVIIFIMSTGCSSVAVDPVKQVIDAINNSEYLTANEIYYESISGNLQLENEVENQLSEIISNAVESYNNGEMTYNEVELILDVVDRADIYNYSALSSSYAELESLQTSKNYYEQAVALEESGEYLDAYEAYEQVSSDDSNYDSAQAKSEEVLDTLLENIIAEADELIASEDFETACIILLSYQDIYAESDEFWEEYSLIFYTCMDTVIADAEALVAVSSYSEAYDVLLNEHSSFDFSGEDLYDAEVTKVSSLWEAVIIKEAEEAFGTDKDYEAAIQVLQRCGLVTDNIDAEIVKYQEYIPINLTSLDYTRKGDHIVIGDPWLDDYYTDVNGTVYDGNNLIRQGAWDANGDEQYVIYSLNSEYSSFTGTIFRTYASLRREGSSWTWYSDVKIYGDGILLYECTDITRDTHDPIDFELDVTGVRELEIDVTGVARCYSSFANDWDTCVILGLGNLILSK